MDAFVTVTGPAVAMPGANIDTDVIMPKQFLKGIDRAGLAIGAFHDLRFDQGGEPRAQCDLNRAEWDGSCFLVVGPNFGCGSSREHAVWGLMQFGIRAVIGTSFAGIFTDNANNNGLLLIELDPAAIARLVERASDPSGNGLTVDLPSQRVTTSEGQQFAFDVSARRKQTLLRGLDAIGETIEFAADIKRLEAVKSAREPWLAHEPWS